MNDANAEASAAPLLTDLLTDLRHLVQQGDPDSSSKLRAGTDRLIIEAMRRVEGTAGSRMAAAEAARACRTLAEDIHECAHLKGAATVEALTDARETAMKAIDHLEAQLANCSPPADPAKPRRRTFPRSSSVIMKKRRPLSPAPAKVAVGGD